MRHQADRHRPVQIRRVQAERVDPLTKNTDYWKPGPALSRRGRMDDHPEPLDPELAFIAGKFDMTFPYEVTPALMHDIRARRRDAICELAPTQRRDQPAGQPRQAAIRQLGYPAGDAAGDRPQGVPRHSGRGPGQHQRRPLAAARRGSGACRRKSCRHFRATAPMSRRTARGPQADGEGRATGRTSTSRSRSRRATSRNTAIRR